MSMFSRKIRQLEEAEVNENKVNLIKATSDKAAEVIKELSGSSNEYGRKIIDNVLLFTNAAGGAGASTILSNVAYTASKDGLKVIILDLNISYPIQHTYLGVAQTINKEDLVSYILGDSELSKSIDVSNDVNLLFANNRGLSDELACSSKIAVNNFSVMVEKLREHYDLVLIDCPMRVDTLLVNTALYVSDAIYNVWDEGIGSMINTEKIRRNMALSGIDSFNKMRVILNKRTSIHFSDYTLKKLELELLEVLPFTVDIIENSLRGSVFCEKGVSTSKNSTEFARKIKSLTDKIIKIGGYAK